MPAPEDRHMGRAGRSRGPRRRRSLPLGWPRRVLCSGRAPSAASRRSRTARSRHPCPPHDASRLGVGRHTALGGHDIEPAAIRMRRGLVRRSRRHVAGNTHGHRAPPVPERRVEICPGYLREWTPPPGTSAIAKIRARLVEALGEACEACGSLCFIPESAVWPVVSGHATRWCSRW
jgi:hypothetical protein